jgi:hypothetical protein
MPPARAALALVLALGACGRGSKATPAPEDARAARDAAPPLELAARPLGEPTLATFGWRKRPGHTAYRAARKAEARDDWPGVVAACQQALATDPDHLDAAWLLAIGLAKTGKLDAVLEPLQVAASGDFGKWGPASLEHPALQTFLATPTGQAWRRLVEQDRQRYVAALERALVVTSAGDLYAYDLDAARWYRLTRTFGAVVGAFAPPATHRLAYVTRERVKTGATRETKVGVGTVDLARGVTIRSADLGSAGPFTLAYSAAKPPSFWIGVGPAWRRLDDDGTLHALPAKTTRPPGPWLDVNRTARLHRLPVASVKADFDDRSLASAIQIGTSNRVVSGPSSRLIDGNTLVWSPDRTHLAFVALLDDRCTPGTSNALAAVADAATGTLPWTLESHVAPQRVDAGLAIEWISDRRLAVASADGVEIFDLDGAKPLALDGATGLVTPRRKPRCTPEPPDEPVEEEPEAGTTDDSNGSDANR